MRQRASTYTGSRAFLADWHCPRGRGNCPNLTPINFAPDKVTHVFTLPAITENKTLTKTPSRRRAQTGHGTESSHTHFILDRLTLREMQPTKLPPENYPHPSEQ